MPAASHQVLVVTDASLCLKGGTGATGLQNGRSASRAFVESVAVCRVGPCHSAGGDLGELGGRGSSNRVEEHEGYKSGDGLVGEMHTVGYI